ncbi:uncharacterized protein FIBRA_05702 [Fibroporia radiculosa]|uniref:Cyclopropane-fatty-acyl-phospholipid synthase n=1 Tax=Fibroporia radiculosa TaxID=599839 RepID=J4IAV4_9APHY|nr:uncharacterized protein FIBRA_05702 [Fibroporia radiculosa]CCM03566.1 predicted protein [Fibroporia radiculosa]
MVSFVCAALDVVHRTLLNPAADFVLGPVCRISKHAVISALNNISDGCLIIKTPELIYTWDCRAPDAYSQLLIAQLDVVNPAFWLRVATSGDLGFAEAYMYGEVKCEDLIDLFAVLLANRSCMTAIDSYLARLCRHPLLPLSNSLVRARYNASAHYDLGNGVFAAFLSRDMTYSCAIFSELDGDLEGHNIDNIQIVVEDQSMENDGLEFDQSMCDGSESDGADISARQTPVKDTQLSSVEDDQELHEAQIRKIKTIVQKADIREGHRVLEIGTGWGALAIWIVNNISGTTIDTLTLSEAQAAVARKRVEAEGLALSCECKDARVRVHIMDYRNMPAEWAGAFDRMVSVEMVEAVGIDFLETYWTQIDWALNEQTGVGCIQGITIPEARFDAYVKDEDFIRKWSTFFKRLNFPRADRLFLPSSHLRNFEPIVLLASFPSLERGTQGRLVVDSVENIGPHYARTLREWRKRFEGRFEDVIVPELKKEYPDVMGNNAKNAREEIDVFKRKWIYYFCYCEAGFASRSLGDHIVTFTREGNVEFGCQALRR